MAEQSPLKRQVLGSSPSGCITETGEHMLEYITLAIVCVGMMVFSIGAVYLSAEEKSYRYDIDITDDKDIL
jgi:hypothetical protein